jgi:hypothetical protein
VLILKIVKVLCFDTLLQVFILKVVREGHENRREERAKAAEKDNAEARLTDGHAQRALRCRRGTPTPGILGKEAASC